MTGPRDCLQRAAGARNTTRLSISDRQPLHRAAFSARSRRQRHRFYRAASSIFQHPQIRRPVLNDRFHAEEPRHGGQLKIRDQLLIEPVVSHHAAADNLDQVVPIAADAIELRDLRQTLNVLPEPIGPGLGVVTGADHDEDGEVQAQRDQTDLSTRAADDAAGIQSLKPAPACVLRQADPIGKLALRQRAVFLQARDDTQIKLVDFFHRFDHMTRFHELMAKKR